jgi:hypothetical protein
MGPMLCVTPNPAIDKTTFIPGFRLGAIHRPRRLIALAGGKGLKVLYLGLRAASFKQGPSACRVGVCQIHLAQFLPQDAAMV